MATPSLAWPELVGYAASILVACSLMLSNTRQLRLVNLAGAVTFTVYGALVGAWPVLAVNLFITAVNIYYLVQMARRSDHFELFDVRGDDKFVEQLLRFHDADIRRFFPDLDVSALRSAEGWLVLRNALPVGIFMQRAASDARIEILLDYVTADHRDEKNARFLFDSLDHKLASTGKKELATHAVVDAHQRYLRRAGFAARGGDWYVRPISLS